MTIIEYNAVLDERRLPMLNEKEKYKIDGRKQYTNPEALFDLAVNAIGLDKAAEEHLYCVAFDLRFRIVGIFEVSHGTGSTSIFSTRETMMKLLYLGAYAFVLMHNHPSGYCTASNEDDRVTKHAKEAANLLGFQMLDHIIVGDGVYYSYEENGKL